MLGGIASGWCGGGGGVEKGPGGPGGVYGMRKERTSETQLIKYVPGSTEQKCVCGFSGVSLFFSKFSCRLQLSWFVGVTGRVGGLVGCFRQARQAGVQAKSAQQRGQAGDERDLDGYLLHAGRTDYFRFEI